VSIVSFSAGSWTHIVEEDVRAECDGIVRRLNTGAGVAGLEAGEVVERYRFCFSSQNDSASQPAVQIADRTHEKRMH
jgi:hypothetical protein